MDKQKNHNFRPPVITLMGHVDHGKTTLLDAIRKTNVALKEHGGITQHIGAYQITHNQELITFVDTPGHAAFEKMRSRGADVADIVILVVAANDGVKPQTLEAIKHIKKAQKPIIVAVTKVDLPDVNIEKVKKELQGQEIIVENYGGDVPLVEVAAPKNKGIDELLEVIELVWQLNPEESKPNDPLQAVVVESFLDKNRGPIVSVIVKEGIIRAGQIIKVDQDSIPVKTLVDDLGKNVKEAGPGKPVEILGFKKTLEVGSIVQDVNVSEKQEDQKAATTADIIAKSREAKDKFKVIIKADVSGSLEAIKVNLPDRILVLDSAVGDVKLADVNFAKVAQTPILAFNVKLSPNVKNLADRENVIIRQYKVIYNLIEEMEQIAQSFSAAKEEQKITGLGKIIATFMIEGQKIAGTQITKGRLNKNDKVTVKSDGRTTETKIASIKKFKKEVESALAGQECGISFSPNLDFKEGDIIESLGQ